jgi:hypothetical protein
MLIIILLNIEKNYFRYKLLSINAKILPEWLPNVRKVLVEVILCWISNTTGIHINPIDLEIFPFPS